MINKPFLTLLSCFLLFINTLSGQVKEKTNYLPDYIKLQFAGNIGFLSGGIGYQFFNQALYIEVLYGHVPKSISKSDKIRTISLKNTVPLYWLNKGATSISPIAGFTISMESGNVSFIQLPDIYPKGYYSPNGIYSTVYLGAMVHQDFNSKRFPRGLDFYMELGTVDAYLWYKLNERSVPLRDILSSSIGINFYF